MISAVFVDRPRLAVVIALVITIAGALALLRIPVAQFPDIVPPQTVVSATFPGANFCNGHHFHWTYGANGGYDVTCYSY